MKKFVFNEKEFYNEIDVENAVNDYAERNVDEYIDDCFGCVKMMGYDYPLSLAIKNVDRWLYKKVMYDYADYLLSEMVEEIEEYEERNDGAVVSCSRKI